ncbi:MAG: hypothetical protein CFE23_10665 [Flavobacterium sp. BFFFF1]|uniref:hypothetical protein n=1 Tax=Flavobacterium sp. BFFFF1 TaxID=2015557 RepID=UPI000BCA55B7|nr:hypothetical protein [Flavobacterium sp. BFFFF1]OYU80173.1 MAG: hypothetical protein CFE23_10665 [Flavobacterium sp. BFFFF1]
MIRNNIDLVNIVLMVLSMAVAVFIPFELFLFVYAVLGPLHYLTEINWLHGRNYFLTRKNDYFFIFFFIGLLLVTSIFQLKGYSPLLIFTTFFGSLALLFFESRTKRFLALIGILVVGMLLNTFCFYHFRLVFSMFLPSIVHVFIFTGLFILLGALKTRSKIGIASIVVFISCSVALLLISSNINQSSISANLIDSYRIFRNLNIKMIEVFQFFHFPEIKENIGNTNDNQLVFFSDFGIKIMRFIAFAYTYHYLNWFSKTSVILWHKTSTMKLLAIFVIWFVSVALYTYNYKVGLQWLYLLSIAHVLLEFPLNHKSLIDIRKQLKSQPSQ